ncbi:MAG: hypothetical protein KBT67_10235 [bacterium]|nr:hypothetical protein [Candidatus Limimorpha caballi]
MKVLIFAPSFPFGVSFDGLREIPKGGVSLGRTEVNLKIQNHTKDEKEYQIIYDVDGLHGDGAVRVVQEGREGVCGESTGGNT